MLEKWTRLIIKRRVLVFSLWAALLLLGVLGGLGLNSHLTTSLTIPDTASARADTLIATKFNENVEGTFTVIYPFKSATPEAIRVFKAQISKAARAIPTSAITEEQAIGGTLFANVNTDLSLIDAAHFTSALRASLKAVGLAGALVTGPPAIKSDVTPILSADLRSGEFIGIGIALFILLLALGFSLQLFIPFLSAVASISATIGAITLIAQKFLVILYTPNIVELIGLGLSIDYSLLILFRFRREILQTPGQPVEAIVKTMASAGRTVAISALAVTFALATLILVPVPFLRSLGLTAALVPLLSLAVALTLQPALLALTLFQSGGSRTGTRLFSQLAEGIVRRPLAVAISALVLLVGLALPAFALHVTPSSLTALPAQLESQRALALVTTTLGPGVITPNEVIIDLGAPSTATNPEVIQARLSLANHLLKNSEVLAVANGEKSPYVDLTGQYTRIFVLGRHSFGAPQSQELVQKLRLTSLREYGFPSSARIFIGGATAQGVDLLSVLTRSLPWIVLLALLAIFLLLIRAFKSLLLPLKAVALDLISLTVTYGIVVLSFGNSTTSKVLGIYHLNQIEAWALLFLLVLLFGTSMDYEVFIISRIKEARDRGLSNKDAIIEGVTETGLVVSTAALIFVGAVAGLALGHFAGLQEIGIGLIFGVLIDATIVRLLLLPSVMVLLGHWNWWLPTPLARLLRTSPAPLEEYGAS